MTMNPGDQESQWVKKARNFGKGFSYMWKPLCWFVGASVLIAEVVGTFFGRPLDPSSLVVIGVLMGVTFVPQQGGGSE